jgi:A/G-specific adenine glycosylase
MPKDEPATFNQAIMEFGHYSACPKSNCGVCVFLTSLFGITKEDRSIAGKI